MGFPLRKAYFYLMILGLILAVTVLHSTAANAAETEAEADAEVRKIHLYATDGTFTMPDGRELYIWGYSLKNEKGTAVYPAPPIEVFEGDEVEVTLTNIGPKKEGLKLLAHTIHWHGLDTDQQNDGVPHTSPAIQVGESFTYRFTATHAGTYFYHCHVDTIEHLQMGMHGALVVKAKGGAKQAWTGGPEYDKEYTFVLNEIDPVWHEAVENGKPYDKTSFHPRYWTINGKAFPDTEQDPDSMIEGKVGETALIRLINSGYEQHSFHMHGYHFQVIASDGRPLPESLVKDTINIGQGERYDILVTFTQEGQFPFHSHNIVDNTNNGVYPGGLHTMVKIASSDFNPNQTVIVLKAGEPDVQVNGKAVRLETAPRLIGDTTYVPLRFIGNEFGAGIEWIGEERAVVYTADQVNIKLWIDQSRALVNGKEIPLETPPVIVDGSSLVPLRFVSENLGVTVGYDPATREITLKGPQAGSGSMSGHGDHSGSGHNGQPATPAPANPSPPSGTPNNGPSIDAPEVTVEIKNSIFSVPELHVKKGAKVTWVNQDTQIHTVIDLQNRFKSGNLALNGAFSYVFDKPGIYVYYCSTHPSMEAKVVVE